MRCCSTYNGPVISEKSQALESCVASANLYESVLDPWAAEQSFEFSSQFLPSALETHPEEIEPLPGRESPQRKRGLALLHHYSDLATLWSNLLLSVMIAS